MYYGYKTIPVRSPQVYCANVDLIRIPPFVQVRLEVRAEGIVRAAFAEAPMHRLVTPLVLKPAAAAEYFDVRPGEGGQQQCWV